MEPLALNVAQRSNTEMINYKITLENSKFIDDHKGALAKAFPGRDPNAMYDILQLYDEAYLSSKEYFAYYFPMTTQTETPTVEAKTATIDCPKKLYDTISAFANFRGGVIIFGLDESQGFREVDIYDAADLQTQITAICCDSMEPAIRPEIHVFNFNAKTLLAAYIPELPENQKPCFYRKKGLVKGSYIRVGDRDEVMTDYELYSLSSYRQHIQEDRRIIGKMRLDDFDGAAIDSYLSQMKILKPQFAKNSHDACLRLSGIVEDDNGEYRPTLAGAMVFGGYPQGVLPQLFVACMVVPGMKLGDTGVHDERFIDNKRIEGTIEEMFNGVMAFLQKNMRTRVVIDPITSERKDHTEYPLQALREVVANALVHRDYSVQAENVYIKVTMYTNRIEIQNPGDLYGMNRIENLGTDAIMETRNSTIVKLLEEKHSIIENRHSGIPTIRRAMADYGLPMPEFIEERGSFKVVLYNGSTETAPQITETTPQITETAPQITETAPQITTKPKRRSQAVSQQMVVEFCSEPRTAEEIMEHLGLKAKGHISSTIIAPLIRAGKLNYTNPSSPHARNQKYIAFKD